MKKIFVKRKTTTKKNIIHIKNKKIGTTRTTSSKKNITKIIENRLKKIVQYIPKKKKTGKKELIKFNIDTKKNNIIIFDTNFLLIPGQFKVDIFEQSKILLHMNQIDMMIFDKTIYELQKICETNSKHARNAKVGLGLINSKNISIIHSINDQYVDDLILDHTKYLPDFKGKIYIATQDKELKQKLIKKNIKVIYLAGKKKLEMR